MWQTINYSRERINYCSRECKSFKTFRNLRTSAVSSSFRCFFVFIRWSAIDLRGCSRFATTPSHVVFYYAKIKSTLRIRTLDIDIVTLEHPSRASLFLHSRGDIRGFSNKPEAPMQSVVNPKVGLSDGVSRTRLVPLKTRPTGQDIDHQFLDRGEDNGPIFSHYKLPF